MWCVHEAIKMFLQYIRLADNTDMDLVLTLLTRYWCMLDPRPPNLLVSVDGGAKNFKLSEKFKNVFNRGLMKVC